MHLLLYFQNSQKLLQNKKKDPDSLELPDHQGHSLFLIAFIAFQFFPQSIISLFGDGDELYFEFAVLFMRTYLFMVLVNGVQLLSSSFFTAIGKALKGALLALTRQTFLLIPLTLLLPLRFGIMGVLLAGPVADFSAFVLSVVLVGIELKKQKKLAYNLSHSI